MPFDDEQSSVSSEKRFRNTCMDKLYPTTFYEFIDNDFCFELVEIFQAAEAAGKTKGRTFQGRYQPHRRLAEYLFLPEEIASRLKSRFIETVAEPLSIARHITSFERIVMYKYPVGVGFEVHDDEVSLAEQEMAKVAGIPVIGGDFTGTVQISGPDDYGGGEMVFPDHGVTAKPPAGALIFFPATRRFRHGINPITSGNRYSVVMRPYTNALRMDKLLH